MNEAMQRMMLAALLTFGLHGLLISWQIQQQPQNLQPISLPRKITVSLQRLPPPLPPIKKIVQEAETLPEIPQVQHQPVRPIPLRPEKKISSAHQAVPKISRIARKPLRPLGLKPVRKPEPEPVPPPVQPRPAVVRHAQPIVPSKQQRVRKSRTQPVPRTRSTRKTVSSAPVRTDVVREAAPLYKVNPPPEYPRIARRRGLEGVVTIEARIDVNGRVTELRLLAGSGHKVLDKAALKAVRSWKFSPGTVGGRARSMWVKVPVRFELH